MEKIACGVVLSANHDVQRYEVEEGNAIGGVIEMKNDGFAIDQTVAEMLRTAGDIALHVLSDRKQLKEVVMIGLAANYKNNSAMVLRLDMNCIDEITNLKQSHESIPFDKAFNLMLNEIKLK